MVPGTGGQPGHPDQSCDVAISIVNHDDRSVVEDCLLSLGPACGPLRWRATLTLNVGGEAPWIPSGATGRLDVIENTTPAGFAANHNRVIADVVGRRSARHVLILNDDARPAPGSVARLVAFLDAHPEVGAVAPTVVDGQGWAPPGRLSYPTLASSLRFDLTGRPEAPAASGWLQGCCLLVRTDALSDVGGFDERFFLFFEDTDLSRRLEAAGWHLAEEPAATVVHLAHSTVLRPDLADLAQREARRSRYQYFAKHHGRVAATTLNVLSRSALAARGTALVLRGLLRRSAAHRAGGVRCLRLARFDPASPRPDR